MSTKKWSGLLAGAVFALACGSASAAEKLTILWAQWDPANYLQELVKDYEKQTGTKVTVETTPWPDFQTKAFREFAAKGDAYDLVVGDSQWLGAGSTAGHYVELTDFFKKHGVAESMAPATVEGYAEYPKGSKKYWAVPLEGDATGWSYRKDWFEDPKEMAAFKKKYGYDLAVPKTWAHMRDIAEFFHRPDQKRYGIAIYTDNSYDALVMGYENVLFGYGGDLGDYSTYKVKGVIDSKTAVDALKFYKELYKFTPPGWGKVFFMEDNQAITEGLAAMSMNFFAFFPALTNPATNKNAKVTGYFANPGGPDRKAFRCTRRPGHLDYQILEEAGRSDKVPGMVHQGRRAGKVGATRRLHLQRESAEVGEIPQGHPVQPGVLRDHVHGQGLLGGAGICGAARFDEQAPAPVHRRQQGHG